MISNDVRTEAVGSPRHLPSHYPYNSKLLKLQNGRTKWKSSKKYRDTYKHTDIHRDTQVHSDTQADTQIAPLCAAIASVILVWLTLLSATLPETGLGMITRTRTHTPTAVFTASLVCLAFSGQSKFSHQAVKCTCLQTGDQTLLLCVH